MTEFDMTDLGLLNYFLGLQVSKSCDGIFVSQEKYALDLLKKFHTQKCKVFSTPMNVNEKLSSLMYLTHTRPDIMFPDLCIIHQCIILKLRSVFFDTSEQNQLQHLVQAHC